MQKLQQGTLGSLGIWRGDQQLLQLGDIELQGALEGSVLSAGRLAASHDGIHAVIEGRIDLRDQLPIDARARLSRGDALGADLAQLRPPVIPIPAGLTFTAGEYKRLGLVMRTWQGRGTALRIGLRLIGARLTGRKMLMMGQALIGRLRLSLKKRGIPLWLDTPMKELIVDGGYVVR